MNVQWEDQYNYGASFKARECAIDDIGEKAYNSGTLHICYPKEKLKLSGTIY